MMKLSKPLIGTYQDYQKYLGDMYEYRKERNVHFTFQYIAEKTETSRSYLKNVIDGRRHLAIEKTASIAKVFELDGFEMDYLIILVLRSTSESQILQERFTKILRGLRGTMEMVPKLFKDTQDEGGDFCLVNTLGGVIYTLADVKGFQFDSAWIHQHLVNKEKYSIAEIEKAMQKLVDLGLLVQVEGQWKQGKLVSGVSSPYSPREAYRMYQPTAVQLYEVFENITLYPGSRILSAKLSFGDDEIPLLQREFDNYIQRIAELSEKAKSPNRVLGFSNNIFPLSHVKS